MFNTYDEQQRMKYKALYDGLLVFRERFDIKLQTLTNKIEGYMSSVGAISLSTDIIPEDIFAGGERRLRTRIDDLKHNQYLDIRKIDSAIQEAYLRYQYYALKVEEEVREKEAKARQERENLRNRYR